MLTQFVAGAIRVIVPAVRLKHTLSFVTTLHNAAPWPQVMKGLLSKPEIKHLFKGRHSNDSPKSESVCLITDR